MNLLFYQIATDTNLTERARLEQRIEDLQIEIRKVNIASFSTE